MVHGFSHAHGIPTTHLRAETMLKLVISAPYALDKGDGARDRFVRGTDDLPFLTKHALKLEGGNHVPVNPVPVAGSAYGIESLKTTRYDDCVGLARTLFGDLTQANRILRALVLTDRTTLVFEVQTMAFVNGIKRRVVFGVTPDNCACGRAFVKTEAAICTFSGVYVGRFLDKIVGKSAVAVYSLQL
jgi:hypothetical protein